MVIHNSRTRYKRALNRDGEKLWPFASQPTTYFPNPDYESNRRRGERRKATGGTCPRSLRKRVFAAFAGVCQYCGWHPDTGYSGKMNYLTVDRLRPGSEGGRYVPTNVTLACLHCNSNRQSGLVYGPARPLSVVEVRHDR